MSLYPSLIKETSLRTYEYYWPSVSMCVGNGIHTFPPVPFLSVLLYGSNCDDLFPQLLEVQERWGLVRRGQAVVECGAAPGAWTQVLADLIGTM